MVRCAGRMNPASPDGLTANYAELLLTSLLVLGLVCVLAWALSRFGASRLRRAWRGRAYGPIQVVARAPLDVGHSLYVVKVAGKAVLLGVGESGINLLGELDCQDLNTALGEASMRPDRGFAAVLRAALGRAQAGKQDQPDEPDDGKETA